MKEAHTTGGCVLMKGDSFPKRGKHICSSDGKESAMQKTWVRSLGREDLLEKGRATHSSMLAWRIPIDRGAWQATVHGVTKGQTRLKRLSTCTPQILKAHTHSLFITFFSLILCPENSTNLISPKFWLSLFSSSSPQCSNLY